MSPDTVVLEMAFLDLADQDELWKEVDEQHLPVDLRRRLTEQGLRGGVIGTQLPGWINERLELQKKTVDIDEKTNTAIVGDQQSQRRLQCRSDHPREIEVGARREELTVHAAGGEQASERTLRDAQCRLSIVSQPQGDGRVRLRVTPEIAHGPPRHRWVGSDGAFRVELSQDCERYDELTIPAVLSPGQTLILGAGREPGGLGEQFFCEEGRSADRQRVLLLRLAQTQFDDLFCPQPTFTPIATDGP